MIKALLTIDDIPTNNTPALVDFLVEKEIKALMFAVGQQIEKHPENVIYALQHGIIVGNHTYSHPNFEEISFEEGIREIEKTDELLDDIYKKAGVERKYKPFRFPRGRRGGYNKDRYEQYFIDNGYSKLDDRSITYPWWKERGLDKDIDTLWTFDLAEYRIRPDSGFTMDDVIKRMEDRHPIKGKELFERGVLFEDGANNILLMHDHEETLAMVPDYYKIMIGHLLERKVIFVPPEFI